MPEAAPARDAVARFMRAWDWVERTIVGLLGLTAMIIAAVQVFGRYIDPANAITWAEEVIVYIVVWAIMIIASQLVRHDGHVRPDLVLRLLPPRVQRWVEMFNCVVAIVSWPDWSVRQASGRYRAAAEPDAVHPTCSSRCGSITCRCR